MIISKKMSAAPYRGTANAVPPPLPMQVKANAVASAADIVFFFFINYIFLNLFFEVKQMPSSLKNTHSQLR